MVCPGQRAPTTSRTSTRNQHSRAGAWVKAAPASEKTQCWTNPVKRQHAHGWALPLAPPNSTCKVYLNQPRLCGKEISVWADHEHGCAKAARNMEHNHIRDWWAQRIRTRKRLHADVRAIPDVGGHPTYRHIVVSSPWTMGTHEGAESEHEGQPHEDRAEKAAETSKMRDFKQPPNTQAVHIIPMAFDVFGWGEKAELALKQAARRRLETRDALRATRSERTLGGEPKEQQQCSHETLRSTATALQGPKNLPSPVRLR